MVGGRDEIEERRLSLSLSCFGDAAGEREKKLLLGKTRRCIGHCAGVQPSQRRPGPHLKFQRPVSARAQVFAPTPLILLPKGFSDGTTLPTC